MVGNAEPVKEYNYRPLSKLCECQLDVNDQVSTKGWWEGGQAEMEGKEKQREREKEASTSSAVSPRDMPASSQSRTFGTQPF